MTIAPKIDATIAVHAYGGNILGQANAIPTDGDAQVVPYSKPKCKIVESGILDIIPVKPNELGDNEKIKIIRVVARGFATDDEMDTDDDMGDFSRKAAKVAHKLIYNNSNETERNSKNSVYVQGSSDGGTDDRACWRNDSESTDGSLGSQYKCAES